MAAWESERGVPLGVGGFAYIWLVWLGTRAWAWAWLCTIKVMTGGAQTLYR